MGSIPPDRFGALARAGLVERRPALPHVIGRPAAARVQAPPVADPAPVPTPIPPAAGNEVRWWALLTVALWHLYGLISLGQTLLADHLLNRASGPPPAGYYARVIAATGSEVWYRILFTAIIVLFVAWVTRLTTRWTLRIALLTIAAIGSVFVSSGKGYWAARAILGREPDFILIVASGFDYNVLVFLATALIYLLRQYWTSYTREVRRVSELSGRLTAAELAALKMQLQPHFLFNTLHSIAAMVDVRPESANRMITDLGDLLRRTLNQGRRQEVSVREELETLECYLAIQRERFTSRLDVQVDVAEEALTAALPHMVLQPLVENAIQHGRSGRHRRLHVRVRGWTDGEWLWLEVSDDGPGFAATRLEAPARVAGGTVPEAGPAGNGVGLRNTEERLRQLYGDGHTLELGAATGGGALIRLRLPLRRV